MTISDVFINLVNDHQGIIHKICRIYARTEDDRRDLFQEILLNAWKSFGSFEFRSKFSTWLYRVALNTALMGLRQRQTKPGMIDIHELADRLPAQPESDHEPVALLYQAIQSLAETDKAIILLFLEDLTYREMSEITGLSESHVGVKINRIKKKLAEKLETVDAD